MPGVIRRAGLALALVSVLVLAACTSPDAAQTSGTASPGEAARLTVPSAVVTFPRPFQADRLVEAQVLIVGDVAGHVTSARLESPLFADSPARDVGLRLAPNWTNHVRLPLGTAVCPAPAGDSVVRLTLLVDGESVEETLAVDGTVLENINAEECAQQAVLDVATPSFGAVESQTASELVTTIVLTREGSQPEQSVTLTSMTGNIVFIVTLDEDAERTLAANEDSLAVPAVISVGRCDPHVFAESKKTFVFPVHLGVGDAEPSYVEIQPDSTARAALQALFDSCGEAEREG